jgi:hypothetical protein
LNAKRRHQLPPAILVIHTLLLVFLIYTPALIAQAPGTFTPTGTLTTPRGYGHTATLLQNGKVLITGGMNDCCQLLASAEIFDPVTGTFTATGDMTVGRSHHSATLLPDGRVLIAGGGGSGSLATAELYDPSTGIFTMTGNMVTAQTSPSATLLNNGTVLITGGEIGSTSDWPIVATPELYDPATGTFKATADYADRNTGSMYGTWGLVGVPATLLPNDTVLIAGEPTAELYDPAIGTFSLTDKMTAYTFLGGPSDPLYINGRTATLLRDGHVLLVGGENEDLGDFIAELYDPSPGKFTTLGLTTTGRGYGHTATLLGNGTVLIAGGQEPQSIRSTELYDPATRLFTRTTDMTSPRFLHTATLLMDGRVLMVGGGPSSGSGELYVPSTLIPAQIVTDLRFDRTSVVTGSSYAVNVSGSNLTPQTFFDVRFTSPGSSLSAAALNWQRGIVESHDVPAGLGAGMWTINGVRAHRDEADHTGDFNPLSATITVVQFP